MKYPVRDEGGFEAGGTAHDKKMRREMGENKKKRRRSNGLEPSGHVISTHTKRTVTFLIYRRVPLEGYPHPLLP